MGFNQRTISGFVKGNILEELLWTHGMLCGMVRRCKVEVFKSTENDLEDVKSTEVSEQMDLLN